MKQFFPEINTNLPCSSRTTQSQFPFKYDICVFIAYAVGDYALFQANPIISINSVDFATTFLWHFLPENVNFVEKLRWSMFAKIFDENGK